MLFCALAAGGATVPKKPPNIIFMLADDLGYNNVGIQQRQHSKNIELVTPTIDELASSGMRLDRMYSYKYCSPSRSSFLSGRLPIHVTQNNKNNDVINPGGADLRMKLLPEILKHAPSPYYTSLVGKWHVGARSKANLPINRGFDRHFGFLKGGEDHLNQTSYDEKLLFVDLWRDHGPAYGENGTFSTLLYAKEAQQIIQDHAAERPEMPLFMFLSWHATHTPLEAPPSWSVKSVPNDTKWRSRAKMNALVEILDEGVRNVTDTLKASGMWENTLLVFQADNGGWLNPENGGNNYPLRGGKVSDFEGGVRNFAFINGGYLPSNLRGTVNAGFAHICDWYATFQSLAYSNTKDLPLFEANEGDVPQSDSINLWRSFLVPNGTISDRTEIPLSYCNEVAECDLPGGMGDSALISGRWKVVNGSQGGLGIWQGPAYPNASTTEPDGVGCPNGCLFDILQDPGEHFDMKEHEPEIFSNLMARLHFYGTTVYQTNYSDANFCEPQRKSFDENKGFLAPRCRKNITTAPFAASGLKTEYLDSRYALSLGSVPRFSWTVPLLDDENDRGIDQSAYRIIVRNKHRGNEVVWDSQVVASNQSTLVEFGGGGTLLKPDTSYDWTVQWFYRKHSSEDLVGSVISSPASFDMGLNDENDWAGARWIGGENHRLVQVSMGQLPTNIFRARVHVAAPGCAILSVNGTKHRASATGVCPWTNFDKTIYYRTFDVLNLLGGNGTLGIMLGHGMYTYATGKLPSMKVKITVEGEGSSMICVSGGSTCTWYGTTGPILSDDPFAGTVIDWNRLPHGWDTSSFDPKQEGWTKVPIASDTPAPTVTIKGMAMPPTIDKRVYKPISVNRVDEYGGPVYVYDLGTNIVGTCSVIIDPTKNTVNNETISLRHGEMLLANGSLNLNYSGHDTGVKAHFQEDHHIIPKDRRRSSPLRLRSSFSWYGFQYVSVHVSSAGYFDGTNLDVLECFQMYPDFETAGDIVFGDDAVSKNIGKRLNGLQKIIITSQLGNLAQYAPTDCPTREKHFWLGDALSIAEEAMLNFHVAPLFANFLSIIADEQGHNTKYSFDFPGVVPVLTRPNKENLFMSSLGPKFGITDVSWSGAFPVILRWMWEHYADKRIVKEHYDTSKRFVDGLRAQANELLNSTLASFYVWGDWCSNQSREIATAGSGPPAAAFNFILSLDAMVALATVLEKEEDVKLYSELSSQARHAWHQSFYNRQHGLYGYDARDGFALQTLTSAPLAMEDVIPEDLLSSVLTHLKTDIETYRSFHQTFGSVGAKHFFSQLSRNGMHATALKVAAQKTFPSFGYWIEQGATSCWENWSGISDDTHPPQPTHNHIFLCGGVGEWMFTHVAGLSLPAGPGFESILLAPKVSFTDGPGSSASSVDSPYGAITLKWKRRADQKRISFVVSVHKPARLQLNLKQLGCEGHCRWVEDGRLLWDRERGFLPGVPGIDAVYYDIVSSILTTSMERGHYEFDIFVGGAIGVTGKLDRLHIEKK